MTHARTGSQAAPLRLNPADDLCDSGDERESERIPFGEGRYQVRVLLSTLVAGSITLMATDVFYLSIRVMDHWCERPAAFTELSAEKWKQMAIPRYPNGSYSKCTVRDSQDAGAPAVVAHCQAWQFNLTQFGHNAVSEWSLVCHRAYLRDVSEAVNLAAAVIVVPLVGVAADHIGRKAVTIVALTALLLALIVSTVALNFTTFAVMASVVAASSRSLSALFVLLYEVTTASRRCLYCTLAPTLPVVLAPLFKYLVDSLKVSWSLSYQLLAVISFVLLATFWFIEESPDWLLATHKPEEAERVVLKLSGSGGAG
ncbi:solute carrier family 22 member 7-like [Haemaphysalis longicornis]